MKKNDLEHMNVDAEAIYDEQISPLMTQIIAICKRHHIPMLCSFQYGSRDGECDFCTTRIPFDGESPLLVRALAVIKPSNSFIRATEVQ